GATRPRRPSCAPRSPAGCGSWTAPAWTGSSTATWTARRSTVCCWPRSSAPCWPPARACERLLDLQHVHDEHQRGVRRDRPRALRAVAELGRDRQHTPAAHLHPHDALVPARDDLAG